MVCNIFNVHLYSMIYYPLFPYYIAKLFVLAKQQETIDDAIYLFIMCLQLAM